MQRVVARGVAVRHDITSEAECFIGATISMIVRGQCADLRRSQRSVHEARAAADFIKRFDIADRGRREISDLRGVSDRLTRPGNIGI